MTESDLGSKRTTKTSGWKVLSLVLIGILVVGLTTPQAYAAADISKLVQQILDIVKNGTYGNQAIKNAVDTKASQTSVNNVQSGVDDANDKLDDLQQAVGEIDLSNLDVAVSSRATQDSVDSLPELREYFFLGAFDATDASGYVISLDCNRPFVVHSMGISTIPPENVFNNDDEFRFAAVVTNNPDYYFVADVDREGGAARVDLVQEAGVPVGVSSEGRLEIWLQQTETDSANGVGPESVQLRMVYSITQDAICITAPEFSILP